MCALILAIIVVASGLYALVEAGDPVTRKSDVPCVFPGSDAPAHRRCTIGPAGRFVRSTPIC